MENQNTTQSQTSVQRLNSVVEELIATVQNQKERHRQETEAGKAKIANLVTEVQNLNNALVNHKNLIVELDNKNKLLAAQMQEMQIKLENSAGNNAETARLQTLLDEANAKVSELEGKYAQAQAKLEQTQLEIDETSQQIDGVIARLGKVLEENGAGNDSN